MRTGSPHAVATLLAFGTAAFLYVTTETLPIGLLSLIATDLATSASAVGLLISAYGLVVVLATVPLTGLTARVPRRRLLVILLAVFVVTVAASALVTNYWALVGCRIGTALSQALFWAIAVPAAAGLFAESVRGRALAVIFGGSSLAAVLGVPAGTWLGQAVSWRASFLAASGLAVLPLVIIAVLLPTTPPGEGAADHGTNPDRGRYRALLASTALAVTGAFVAFTYVDPFLGEVTAVDSSAIGPMLLLRGLAGVLGVFLVGLVVDRNPWLTMLMVTGLQAVALGVQYLFGGGVIAAGASIAVAGLTFAAIASLLGVRVLILAPGTSDMASAGTSTAFNVGITTGSLIGGGLLPIAGVRSTPLVGALFTVAALAVVLAEPALATAKRDVHARPHATQDPSVESPEALS